MFPGVIDSRETRPSWGSYSAFSLSFLPRISQRDIQVQKMEEQLRQMQQELAQDRAANKAKDDYLLGQVAQMEQSMMQRKHNTTHPFCFSGIYVLALCNYRH
jgi:hypothetical protein